MSVALRGVTHHYLFTRDTRPIGWNKALLLDGWWGQSSRLQGNIAYRGYKRDKLRVGSGQTQSFVSAELIIIPQRGRT